MNAKLIRAGLALVFALAAAGAGYAAGTDAAPVASVSIPAQTVAAPAAGAVRVLYSLDAKQNDKELIAVINGAKTHIYFAIYEFTLKDVADALVAAKKRGVDVQGLVDSGESSNSYDRPIIQELVAAGIPVETEKHPDGNGIMHIKALATDSAYALGSYNWTGSATTENDELLEIGTDPTLVSTYADILQKLIQKYKGNAALSQPAAQAAGSGDSEQGRTISGTYDYADAPKHVGEYASVSGTLVDAYTSASGTVFLDFCKSYKTCSFSGVIFADDVSKFGDLNSLAGTRVTLTGTISSYNGKAEIKLSDPSQLQ